MLRNLKLAERPKIELNRYPLHWTGHGLVGPISSPVHWKKALKLSPIKIGPKSYWAFIFLKESFSPNCIPLTFRFRVCNLCQRSCKHAPQELNCTMKPTSSVFSSYIQVSLSSTHMNMFVYFIYFLLSFKVQFLLF